MNKVQDLMRKFDQYVMKQTDTVIASPTWQQIADRTHILKETHQKVLNHLITNLLTFSPLIITLIVLFVNMSYRSSVTDKQSLIDTIENIGRYKNQLSSLERNKLSKTAVTNVSSAKSMVDNILRKSNTKTDKISIGQFKSRKFKESSIQSSRMEIKFKDFSNNDFTNLLKGLLNNEKAIMPHIKLTKIEKTRSLEGSIKIQHYSKSSR